MIILGVVWLNKKIFNCLMPLSFSIIFLIKNEIYVVLGRAFNIYYLILLLLKYDLSLLCSECFYPPKTHMLKWWYLDMGPLGGA